MKFDHRVGRKILGGFYIPFIGRITTTQRYATTLKYLGDCGWNLKRWPYRDKHMFGISLVVPDTKGKTTNVV